MTDERTVYHHHPQPPEGENSHPSTTATTNSYFLIRLKTGALLILEVKGQQTDSDEAKQKYAREWAEAVTEHGGFGHWRFDVSSRPSDMVDILQKQQNSLCSCNTSCDNTEG